jgi:hypothetical protein
MFRFLALIILLLTFGWVAVALKSRSITMAAVGNRMKGAGSNIYNSIIGIKTITSKEFGQKFVFPVLVFTILLLGLTGFVPPVLFGMNLSGYLLLLHVVLGPVFILFMAIGAIIWAQQNLFDSSDWTKVVKIATGNTAGENSNSLFKKLCFWGITILALPAVCSVVSSMYKIFGTHGQEFLLNLHRYTTLGIVILTAIYVILKKFENVDKK